jgi:uncharacterized protein
MHERFFAQKGKDRRDPKDDMYLALATCIVSGDSDLLELNPFRGIPIINARAFLDLEL